MKPQPRFSRVLVANRGEIACRIIRSAKESGYTTIAVYSDADANAPHVKAADFAVRLGEGPVAESYLSIERLLEAAVSSGAQAVHPGYGFLSENAGFARACEAAGLVFIGPSAGAIELMGNKALAKQHMLDAGVPCVPGFQGGDQSHEQLSQAAKKLGLPLMIKAASGGGGRGMRLLSDFAQLDDALESARSEAEQAFGSGELILEKAVQSPRHVEVQVFADQYGNTIDLGERDCSIQRRHQKVIEEAPCPAVSPELRQAMGAAAIAAAKSVNYCGAGTVEFLLDPGGAFYFLEMNTRLQVEHPVTEMVTGLDLVTLQLKVAQGEPLGIDASDVQLDGHAIEVRLYAEDPAADFLPTTGQLIQWKAPSGEGIRVDSGIEAGVEISSFYDPLLAKIIAWGRTRDEARQRLLAALQASTLFGLRSNREFLIDCLADEKFASGELSTAFIEERFSSDASLQRRPDERQLAVAALIQHLMSVEANLEKAQLVCRELAHFGSAHRLTAFRQYQVGNDHLEVCIRNTSNTSFDVLVSDRAIGIRVLTCENGLATLEIDGQAVQAEFSLVDGSSIWLKTDAGTHCFTDKNSLSSLDADAQLSGHIRAPMHGQIMDVRVSVGDVVKKGQTLLRMEAMKMQHEIVATVAGQVDAVKVIAGAQVASDALLIELNPGSSTLRAGRSLNGH